MKYLLPICLLLLMAFSQLGCAALGLSLKDTEITGRKVSFNIGPGGLGFQHDTESAVFGSADLARETEKAKLSKNAASLFNDNPELRAAFQQAQDFAQEWEQYKAFIEEMRKLFPEIELPLPPIEAEVSESAEESEG